MKTKDQKTPAGASRNLNSPLPAAALKTRVSLALTLLVVAAVLAACTGSSGVATPTTVIVPPANLNPAPQLTGTSPAGTAVPQGTGTPITLDPCVLLPSSEASALAGATFGEGTKTPLSGGAIDCIYGANTTNVLTVEVAQAPDAATAQQYKAQFLADLQAHLAQLSAGGLTVTQVPNFADGAVLAVANLTYAGVDINGSAFGFVKGAVFFGLSDEVQGGPAPTSDALQAQATTVLGRLP